MYCLILIGIGLVSMVAMFLQVIHALSNLYWYRIGQLGSYVLTGNTMPPSGTFKTFRNL